jgi:hypothetical protein
MNRAEVLGITVDFMVANHKYVTLIQRTFIDQGRLKDSITSQQVQMISDAKNRLAGLEQQMYAAWRENGIS